MTLWLWYQILRAGLCGRILSSRPPGARRNRFRRYGRSRCTWSLTSGCRESTATLRRCLPRCVGKRPAMFHPDPGGVGPLTRAFPGTAMSLRRAGIARCDELIAADRLRGQPHDVGLSPSRLPRALQWVMLGLFLIAVVASGVFARNRTLAAESLPRIGAGLSMACTDPLDYATQGLGYCAVRSRLFDVVFTTSVGARCSFLAVAWTRWAARPCKLHLGTKVRGSGG